MKSVIFKTSDAAARQGGAMEFRDHFKNGANSKSHTSRGNFIKSTCLSLLATGIIILSACSSSSPEKDGIKAAKQICDCRDDMTEIVIKATESYIKNFNFNTRIEAREKLNEMQQKVEADYRECINNANAYRDELKSKYITNQENVGKFDYAYNAHVDAFVPKPPPSRYEGVDFQSQIETMIKSIIPPKPDLEKLKKDLIGREFKANIPNNEKPYYLYNWTWKVKSLDELKEVEILDITGNDNQFDMNLRMKGQVNQFDITITYALQGDDWRLLTSNSKLTLNRTGKYDGFIEIKKEKVYDGDLINFINHSDVELVVVGVIEQRSGSRDFSVKVPAKSTQSIGYWDHYPSLSFKKASVQDYKIHFIERSGI